MWRTNQVVHGLCTIASKRFATPKVVYLSISKLHSILAVANLLALNNISQICYCGQISLQRAAVDCSFSDTFGGNIYFAGDDSFPECEHWMRRIYAGLEWEPSEWWLSVTMISPRKRWQALSARTGPPFSRCSPLTQMRKEVKIEKFNSCGIRIITHTS